MVYDFAPAAAAERIEAWCATAPEVAAEDGWARWELEEHVRDENSTFSWLLEAMIRRAGFGIEYAGYSGDAIFAEYILRRP